MTIRHFCSHTGTYRYVGGKCRYVGMALTAPAMVSAGMPLGALLGNGLRQVVRLQKEVFLRTDSQEGSTTARIADFGERIEQFRMDLSIH